MKSSCTRSAYLVISLLIILTGSTRQAFAGWELLCNTDILKHGESKVVTLGKSLHQHEMRLESHGAVCGIYNKADTTKERTAHAVFALEPLLNCHGMYVNADRILCTLGADQAECTLDELVKLPARWVDIHDPLDNSDHETFPSAACKELPVASRHSDAELNNASRKISAQGSQAEAEDPAATQGYGDKGPGR